MVGAAVELLDWTAEGGCPHMSYDPMFGLPESRCGITLEDEVVHETQQPSS